MLIKKISDVPAQPVDTNGAQNVSIRVLFGPKDGAPTFAMRQFELEPEGQTPFHEHPFEHQVLILSGKLALVTKTGDFSLTVGDVVMILPGEKHRFRNTSNSDSAKMICMIPVEYQK